MVRDVILTYDIETTLNVLTAVKLDEDCDFGKVIKVL